VATLAATVQREAYMLAYVDGFWLTLWFAVTALLLVSG
jgi:MFS transporter, DHA2 family, multidrug resistance protein